MSAGVGEGEMTHMRRSTGRAHRRIARGSRGVTAIEYGLIAALIFLAIVGALNSMATAEGNLFSFVADHINPALAR